MPRQALKLLKGMGYERVGEVVAQHIWLCKEGDPSSVSEEEIVNYADKRVMHDRIVSLEERFSDLKERYGRKSESHGLFRAIAKGNLRTLRIKSFLFYRSTPMTFSIFN